MITTVRNGVGDSASKSRYIYSLRLYGYAPVLVIRDLDDGVSVTNNMDCVLREIGQMEEMKIEHMLIVYRDTSGEYDGISYQDGHAQIYSLATDRRIRDEEEAIRAVATTLTFYVIEDISTWARNMHPQSELERFSSLPEAIARFKEYRSRPGDSMSGYAQLALGASTPVGEVDIIHVRNNQNWLLSDFHVMGSDVFRENIEFHKALGEIHREIGFDAVRVYDTDQILLTAIPFSEWENRYF